MVKGHLSMKGLHSGRSHGSRHKWNFLFCRTIDRTYTVCIIKDSDSNN